MQMSIVDIAVLILVATLIIMVFLLRVDSRFPILVSIGFLVASAVFYYWDPNPWAILAFYSFVTGLIIIVIERLRASIVHVNLQETKAAPFFGRLDRVRNLRKKPEGK